MKKFTTFAITLVLFIGMAYAPAGACCYLNKDVHNGSGQDAYDIEIYLRGNPTVEWTYDDMFDTCIITYDSVLDYTTLHWQDPPGPIHDSDWVHIGYELDGPADIIEVTWTDINGDPLPNGHVQQASHYVERPFESSPSVELILINTVPFAKCPDDAILGNIVYAVLDTLVSLDALNAENTALAALFAPVPGGSGPFPLAEGDSLVVTIPVDVLPGQVLVYRLEGSGVNAFVDFGQHKMNPVVPTLSEWGLIIFALLIMTLATVVMTRRKRATAAA